MNHYIIVKNPNIVWKPKNIKPTGKFLADIFEKLKAVDKSSHVYRSEDISY